MAEIFSAILLLIAVIDPMGSVPVYLEATKNFDTNQRKKIAINSSLIAFFVLFFFIVVGQIILDGMEISLEAFQISGGVILFLFAISMVLGESKPESEMSLITDYKKVTIFPVALPSIASPGAILAVVLMTDNKIYSITQQLITIVELAFVVGLTCLVLLVSNKIQKRIGEGGIIVISKVMGLILAAYAAQSILSGIKTFFMS
ncbi:MarC family protein [Flavicella marina]|uniref:MarC family protein n=1 Tax=Flavicella marina TaxID=1475951 RepID=UPI001264BF05|nr:MarC family protein [Flavicella marina]